ncbi:hypothetical protein [Lactococcus allomyrinae]|uniref:Uncharacterized protein n=1 Tax=Lactococcus allomyrinae TaxID=2419773 RepID=A0A387BHG6_9LACT|nr:hypothetical protein [Lactococcus allomyrinae]AYG01612.1 hypothetical protein D7I46_11420 [Lactococcus allomyrinae]
MFAGSYKIIDGKTQLTRLGIFGSIVSFMMLSLMIQWPLLQAESQFSAFSQFMLWTAPVLVPLLLSGIYFVIAKWRSTHNKTSYSYGVAYHWTLASLLPVAALVSLAEYFAIEALPTAVVHATGLIVALTVYGMLLLSRRAMMKHSRVLLFTYGFYALAAALQVVLFVA